VEGLDGHIGRQAFPGAPTTAALAEEEKFPRIAGTFLASRLDLR
jgi:hypothetical protein